MLTNVSDGSLVVVKSLIHPYEADGTLESVWDYAIVVNGEVKQSFEEEGRTGAANNIIKVTDGVQPF